MIKKEQLKIITQQMANTASAEDLCEQDPQLGRLLAKYFTLFVGIDVCLTSFMVVIKNSAFQVLGGQQFDNETQGFEHFMELLKTLNPDNTYRIQAAVECTSVYHLQLVRFLSEKGIEVYLYNAQTAHHLAKAYLKEKKTDTLDASLLANLLIDGKFPVSITPQENEFIEIRSLSRRSGRYAEQIAQAKTRLKDELAQASVGMLRVFPKQAVFNKAPMHLMQLYPLPTDRLAAGVSEVARLLAFSSNNKYGQAEAEKLLTFDAKNQGDERLFAYFRQSLRDYIEEIQYFITKQEQYVTRMEAQTKELKPAQHLLSLPGCGRKLMPIILGEAGTMDRFSAADRFVGYAGLAPIEHESGPYKGEKHLKKGGSPRLSHACYMIANCARRYDERLKGLYTRVKERHLKAGKPKGVAHIIANCAVAREIALLIYCILKENRPYFPSQVDYRAYQAAQKSAQTERR